MRFLTALSLRLLAILWASPYTVLGLLVGIIGLCAGGRVRRRGHVLEFYGGGVKWLFQRYITEGRALPQAEAARRRFGKWDTEWSLAPMLRILRAAIPDNTMKHESATKADLCQLLSSLESSLNLAV